VVIFHGQEIVALVALANRSLDSTLMNNFANSAARRIRRFSGSVRIEGSMTRRDVENREFADTAPRAFYNPCP
jgi:hypothetical protein